MESLDYWRLCDELTVLQAALLIVGEDPADNTYVESTASGNQPTGYLAAKTALLNAISAKELYADKRDAWTGDGNDSWIPLQCLIKVTDLQFWLSKRGIVTGFFFPKVSNSPDYLDANHPNYAPKLAAAIEAWQAVTSRPELMKAKTAKQGMIKWLRENASRFGLTKDDGNPNEQGIEEIAKIANWDTKGGAPKTPEG
jgi:hypothetical protein